MATKRKPVPGAPVKWTKPKQLAFLEHLTISSNVAASARAADVPIGAAYRFRDKSPQFRRNWELALKTGYDRLELTMLERAIDGTRIETTDRDGNVTVRFEHSEKLAMTLLNAHRETVGRIAAAQGDESAKATLARKLAAMSRRPGVEG